MENWGALAGAVIAAAGVVIATVLRESDLTPDARLRARILKDLELRDALGDLKESEIVTENIRASVQKLIDDRARRERGQVWTAVTIGMVLAIGLFMLFLVIPETGDWLIVRNLVLVAGVVSFMFSPMLLIVVGITRMIRWVPRVRNGRSSANTEDAREESEVV